jgi:hypothetical protein
MDSAAANRLALRLNRRPAAGRSCGLASVVFAGNADAAFTHDRPT